MREYYHISLVYFNAKRQLELGLRFFPIYRSKMTTKIIVTFFLLILSTWTTKTEEIKLKKPNFQVKNKNFWKFEVNAKKELVKVRQLVIKISY